MDRYYEIQCIEIQCKNIPEIKYFNLIPKIKHDQVIYLVFKSFNYILFNLIISRTMSSIHPELPSKRRHYYVLYYLKYRPK